MQAEQSDAAARLVLRFARVGHEAGYPTADLEDRVTTVARAVGLLEAEVSVTPTLVEVALGSPPHQRSYSIRVRPSFVDLDAIARLDDLVQRLTGGELDSEGALAALDEIDREPLRRPVPIVLAAYAVAGAALTPVLGGSWREAGAAALVGLVVGAIALSSPSSAWMPLLTSSRWPPS